MSGTLDRWVTFKPSKGSVKDDETPLSKAAKDSGLGSATDSKTQMIEETPGLYDSDDDATQINSEDFRLLDDDVLANEIISKKEVDRLTYWEEKFTLISPESKEKVSVAVQTDLLLPSETTPLSFKVLNQVNVLKGMLKARDWALQKQGTKIVGVHDLLNGTYTNANVEAEIVEKMAIGPEDCGETDNPYTELDDGGTAIVDLTSSPDRNNDVAKPTCQGTTTAKTNDYVREVLRYSLLRHTPDDPIADAFRVVLNYIKEQVQKNSQYVIENWTGSLVEAAAEILLKTSDIEGSVSSQLLFEFCDKLLDEVTNEDHYNQANNKENYVSIVIKLCDSVTVSCAVVDCLIQNLSRVQILLDGPGYRLVDHVHVVESLYHVLHILSTILLRIADLYKKGSIGEVQNIMPNESNQGVLHLWKRHWRPMEQEVSKSPGGAMAKFELWQETLESILRTSFVKSPILSPLLMNCIETIKAVCQ